MSTPLTSDPRWLGLFSLGCLLSLSACSGEERIRCLIDADCAIGQVCTADNQCAVVSSAKCAGDADCVAGSYCTRGGCSSRIGCKWDRDCASGFICTLHACAPVECAVNDDCSSRRCRRGRCVSSCGSNADCGPAKVCQNGGCDEACVSDDACDAGQICRAGRCQAECETSADCASGEACAEGRCIQPECRGDGDCADSARCEGFRCVPSRPCADDSACGADERCADGYCLRPECQDNAACKLGYECRGWRCRASQAEDGSWQVAEEDGVVLPVPAGAQVTDPGSSRLGRVQAVEGGVRLDVTSCVPGTEQLVSHVRGADGVVQTMTSTIQVVDPGPPERTALQLTDRPGQRQVAVSFTLPPENPGGSRCRPVRYELAWDDGTPQTRTGEVGDRQLGDLLSEVLPVSRGDRVTVRLRLYDEQDQVTESTAELPITRAEVTGFSITANNLRPTELVELNWTTLGASRVQLLRDGAVVYDGPEASGSQRFPVGGRASVFSLRYYDTQGNPFTHPITHQLQIRGQLESEPNDARAQADAFGSAGAGAGYVGAGEVDLWRLRNTHNGGHFDVTAQEIGGACISQLRLELLNAAGTRLAQREGACPRLGVQDLADLPVGDYYLRVTGLAASDYALRAVSAPASCGNRVVEQRAGEECDGWSRCNASCRTTLAVSSSTQEFPSQTNLQLGTARLRLVMTQAGWIDVGTGDYQLNTCQTLTEVTLSNASGQLISGGRVTAPLGCQRIVRKLSPGTYYVTVRATAASGVIRLNYAAHVHGSCGDGVVDPTSNEQCDPPSSGGPSGGDVRTCSASCRYLPGASSATEGTFTIFWYRVQRPRVLIRCEGGNTNWIDFEAYSPAGHYLYHTDMPCVPSSFFHINTPSGFFLANQMAYYKDSSRLIIISQP